MKATKAAFACIAAGILMCLSGVALSGEEQIDELETVVVTGEHPGPGLWKVSKGDHVMWVLGTYTPLPKGLIWRSRNVEGRIAESQEVILPASVGVNPGIGFFRVLTLVPAIIKSFYLPDHKTLRDVLPAATWGKWRLLREKYIGPGDAVERLRPAIAIDELRDKAYSKNRLTDGPVVEVIVKSAAKKHKVRVRSLRDVEPKMKTKSADIRAGLTTMRDVADVECFTRSLDRLESDVEQLKLRANAWAKGDVEALRHLHLQPEMGSECDSMFEASITAGDSATAARMKQLDNEYNRLEAQAKAQAERDWIAAVRKALDRNKSTFAVLSIREVVGANGYVAKLKGLGYEVEGPPLTSE
ncbi:MAG: TraB/GumN family protein [Steroidobacteraceae bacterium]